MNTKGGQGRSSGSFTPLPTERLELIEGWAMLSRSMAYVYRPSTDGGVQKVLELARSSGRTVSPRGSGYSYGDASLNAENIVLDLTRMNRVLHWNPDAGLIRVEPGVTISQLWRYTLEDGWWPPVVPGTLHPTVGGCLAVNVHGKNNWLEGTFGDHVVEFSLLLADGRVVTCNRSDEPEMFWAAIGGLGMLGIFLSITLRLKRVSSGLLRVEEHATTTLNDMFAFFETWSRTASYLVGWVDAFATGTNLGRGLVQVASHVNTDPSPERTLRSTAQDLPDTVFGVVPRSRLWLGMKPLVNDAGMRVLNGARFKAGSLRPGKQTLVPHAQFHFFHDYVPGWKNAFRPGGIVQYQVFVPRSAARRVFATLLEASQEHGHIPYLAVFKLHRKDSALLGYNVDGYSLSLDYHSTQGNGDSIRHFLDGITGTVVLPAGGRFYPAKDTVLHRDYARTMYGSHAVDEFLALKDRVDRDGLFQSDLYRRFFRTSSA